MNDSTEPRADAASPRNRSGRDSGERSVAGNRGGTGGPFSRQSVGLREALLDLVTDQDIDEIAQALLVRAKGGDWSAIEVLFRVGLSRPLPPGAPLSRFRGQR